MRRSGDIGRATLDAARRALAALADRADAMTKKQAVRALGKEIGAARDNGCGFDEIAAELTKSGIAIGTSTLKGYWSQEPGPGSDFVETPAERRPRQSQSTRTRPARSRVADEASVLARQAAEGPSPSASRTAGVGGREDRLAVDPAADVSTGEVREPAAVAEEPADGGAQDTFQLASVGEPTVIEPRADASPGEVRQPAAIAEEPADGGLPDTFQPASVGERTEVEPPSDPPPGKVRKAAVVAERPAKGRAAAAPPPAGGGAAAGRSPVDEPADAPPVNGDGQPVVDLRGTHVVKINRGEI